MFDLGSVQISLRSFDNQSRQIGPLYRKPQGIDPAIPVILPLQLVSFATWKTTCLIEFISDFRKVCYIISLGALHSFIAELKDLKTHKRVSKTRTNPQKGIYAEVKKWIQPIPLHHVIPPPSLFYSSTSHDFHHFYIDHSYSSNRA